MMTRWMLATVLMLLPLPALAQSALPSGDTDLQQRIRQKRIIVQPRPAPDVVRDDARQAIDDLAAQQRREETLRALNRSMPRRPDLDESVTGGIQTRTLNSIRPR